MTTKSNNRILGDGCYEALGNSLAASNEDVTSRRAVITPVKSLQVGRGCTPTGRFAQRPGSTSPGISSPSRGNGGSPLDKLAKFMPTETFIPISTTFRSIVDACRTGYVSPRNLQGAFNEVSNSSKEAGKTSEIVIQPTIQVIDNTEDESGLMINAECQTDSPTTTEFEMQTEIRSGTDAEIQMCIKEDDEKAVQTEVALKICETQTTELDSKPEMKTTGCQAESHLKTSETQTHIEAHMKEVQTYFCGEDKETQASEADTSKPSIGADKVLAMEFQGNGNVEDKHPTKTNEQSVETDLQISISTKLEVVDKMHSWDTQTNIMELSEMQPIISRISGDYKDASETDSLISSASHYDA